MSQNKPKKHKFYGIYSKNDNFLYGVFPFSKEGFKLAKNYIQKKLKTKTHRKFRNLVRYGPVLIPTKL